MRILHSSCTVQLFPGLVVHTRDSHDKTPLGNALQSSIVLETTRAVAHGNRPCLLRGHSSWAFVFWDLSANAIVKPAFQLIYFLNRNQSRPATANLYRCHLAILHA